MAVKTKKKFNSDDTIWQTVSTPVKKFYVISSDRFRREYDLWEKTTDDKYTYIMSGETPRAFAEFIDF